MATMPTSRIDFSDAPPLRWGVVGTGAIAGAFVDAARAHTRQRPCVVTARDPDRTAAFAAAHGLRAVASVDRLVCDEDVDVVYIATPHPSHAAIAEAAIAQRKPVLIEKPFAMTAEEARRVIGSAREAGVLVMEAMWTRYLPQTDVVRQIVADGLLGDVRAVTADFGFAMPYEPGHRLWDPALGGGALLDAGVYPISFATMILGAPSTVEAHGRRAPSGVDSHVALRLEHAGGAESLLLTSLELSTPTMAAVMGTRGNVRVHAPFWGQSGITLTTGGVRDARTVEWVDATYPTPHDALGYQADAVASYVARGLLESPLHPLDEVVATLAVIEQASGRF
ncbi:Gfo/Idh/MocA family oxidoreductase [Cnuibacter physcomitrellae]|uniref:Gfo/Idh/MocA family oxidoreductase n=1 Tax=Cnuibacter physcomitrellae TaxID=1619308 RepID=UPI002175F8BA|nr:Gfo/Idh/MocA family oxidoreductase [Cnuibacter physcomitrellae]MCS5498366.1 Gfo/Idh/MocA family oxidoreductase [Cnuibacter physcomitrellae]